MIPVATTNESSPVDRVRDWFLENYAEHLNGIEDFEQRDEDVFIHLREPLDLEEFRETMESNGYDTEFTENSNGRALNVLRVEELGEDAVQKYKVGSTYHESYEVSLGGVSEPIWENGEFAGKAVEETFDHIVEYLEHCYN